MPRDRSSICLEDQTREDESSRLSLTPICTEASMCGTSCRARRRRLLSSSAQHPKPIDLKAFRSIQEVYDLGLAAPPADVDVLRGPGWRDGSVVFALTHPMAAAFVSFGLEEQDDDVDRSYVHAVATRDGSIDRSCDRDRRCGRGSR